MLIDFAIQAVQEPAGPSLDRSQPDWVVEDAQLTKDVAWFVSLQDPSAHRTLLVALELALGHQVHLVPVLTLNDYFLS